MASTDYSDFPFPQLQPAFVCDLTVDVEFGEGNIHDHLITGHVTKGKMFTIPGCGLPSFTAEVVTGLSCQYLQQCEYRSPTTPTMMGGDFIALLKVTDGPPKSTDPTIAALESGLIRMQFTAFTKAEPKDLIQNAFVKLAAECPNPADRKPIQVGGTGCQNFVFETSDPRFYFMKYHHFIGESRLLLQPDADAPGGFRLVGDCRISYVGCKGAPGS